MSELPRKFKIEFVIKASAWAEVVNIFAEELGINKEKRNASDRNIVGLFIVSVLVEESKLAQDFYDKVRKSQYMSIIEDEYSDTLRETILIEVAAVERRLRKLLLHVSDLVSGYYDYFSKTLAKDMANKNEVNIKDDINAITSYLTFEETINILGADINTWNNKPLTANDLLQLLESSDLVKLKKTLKQKMKTGIVWDSIAKHVLDNRTSWVDIKDDLYRLKELRNKAAHFRVLSCTDVKTAKTLSKSILARTEKKDYISDHELTKLREETFRKFYDSLYGATELASAMAKVTDMQKLTLPDTGMLQSWANAALPNMELIKTIVDAVRPATAFSQAIADSLTPYNRWTDLANSGQHATEDIQKKNERLKPKAKKTDNEHENESAEDDK